MSVRELITDHLDLWTGAVTHKSSTGRGRNGKIELTGINKLRELILELAVRGKLVDQDPDEEPASVLLERIAQEKARLVKDGKIRKPKKLPEITEEEKPFELPDSWEWVWLGSVCELENGDRSKNYPNKSSLVETGIPFINAGNLQNYSINTSDLTFITEERFNLLRSGKIRDGDILFCLRGSLGKCGLVKNIERGAIASSLIIVRPFLSIISDHIMLYLKAPISERMIRKYDNGTAQPNLSGADFRRFLIPLPGESEQHRIVEKVDELMALCDRLEQQVGDQLEAHEVLVDTLLDALTRSSDAAELAENWARIAEHFDTLFTAEASIDKLKQTILQLAVMGRLVPQDPNDEPASVLLEKIAEEKARLVKEGKIKKQKKSAATQDNTPSISLPAHWSWESLGELTSLMDAGWSPACPPEPAEPDTWGVLKTTAVQVMEYLEDENKKLPDSKEPKKHYEVKSGDVLITRAGPKNRVGVSCLVKKTRSKLMISDKIIRFHLIEAGLSEEYICLCLNAGETYHHLESAKSGMAESQMNISQDKLKAAPIPLCPTNEQHRIIERVDELMALCDQLKKRLGQVSEARWQLAEVLVQEATS